MFRNHRAFTAVAVLTLALGIGLNAAVFTVTNAVLFRGFPHLDPDNRLVYLDTSHDGVVAGVSYADYLDWRAQARSFGDLAVVSGGGLRLPVRDAIAPPEICDATELSANAFDVLGQRPVAGRAFASSDEEGSAAPVVVMSYGFWSRRYGRNPAVIGETIQIDGTLTTVIGVMGPAFEFPHHRVDLWLPIVPARGLRIGASIDRDAIAQRQRRTLWFAFGRLVDGATLEKASAEMATIGRRLQDAYPVSDAGYRPTVRTFSQFFIGASATAMYGAMWGAVGLVLLIACANLANLLLGRAIDRSREISVRAALGARRLRVIRQLLAESVTLSAAGGLCGSLIALWSVHAYERFANASGSYTRWEYGVDGRVFAYLVLVTVAAGLAFGLVPALRMSRFDVNGAIKEGSHGAAGGRRGHRFSRLLVAGEMALAVVLLAGAGVMIRSFLAVYRADIGVQTNNVLAASVTLPRTRYGDLERQRAYFRQVTAALAALPGVDSIALATRLPTVPTSRDAYEIAGDDPVDAQRRSVVATVGIGPRYFGTVGAAVLAGRSFEDADETADAAVAIVNRQFARAAWPGRDPIGRRIRLFDGTDPGRWLTIVGVAPNIVQNDLTGQQFEPIVYVPFWRTPRNGVVIARTRVPPATLVAAFRREMLAIDPDLAIGSGLGSIAGPQSLADTLAFTSWRNRVDGILFMVFAAVAVLLASIGLYAVLAGSVGRRTRELGIRLAMGATGRDVIALVLEEGMTAVGAGLVLGLLGSLALNPLLRTRLVRVSPFDPLSLVAACAVLMGAAAIGCWIPARRANRVDPVVALRQE